jgi:hypothetical protein
MSSIPTDSTYETLSEDWWNWVLSIPNGTSGNPVNDTAGVSCNKNQTFSAWFLAGTLGTLPPVIRNCTVKPRKKIFFPVINKLVSTGEYPSLNTESLLRKGATDAIDHVTTMEVTLDGQSITAYRVETSKFRVIYGPGNIYAPAVPAGTYDGISDGYWVLLDLPSGNYNIHFVGVASFIGFQLGQGSTFRTEVTYNLTVA